MKRRYRIDTRIRSGCLILDQSPFNGYVIRRNTATIIGTTGNHCAAFNSHATEICAITRTYRRNTLIRAPSGSCGIHHTTFNYQIAAAGIIIMPACRSVSVSIRISVGSVKPAANTRYKSTSACSGKRTASSGAIPDCQRRILVNLYRGAPIFTANKGIVSFQNNGSLGCFSVPVPVPP